MEILFVAGVAVITPDPEASARLYRDALGLPLEDDGGYLHSADVGGVKHFGVWPLPAAAQACFGVDDWPPDIPTPSATIEFEVADVASAAAELEARGYRLLHPARTEPWGQTVARLMSPEGLLVGLSFAPWFHE